MKSKTIIKIILDVVMAGLFIALMFAYQTGLVFHEIIGLSIVSLFALHLILNGKWIVSSTKKMCSGTLSRKPLINYLIDAGLFIGIVVLTVTGFLISVVLFPTETYNPVLKTLHTLAAYVTSGLLALHLLVHIKYLKAVFKKFISEFRSSVVKKSLGSAAALLMTAGIIYYNVIAIAENDYQSGLQSISGVIVPPVSNESASEQYETEKNPPKKKDEDEIITQTQPAAEAVPTLSEYLGKMFCTICHRRCPLSSPQCRKSASLIQKAKTEYQELYENSTN